MTVKCDFCGEGVVGWRYPASDFEPSVLQGYAGSSGAWAACDECHALIESECHDKLAQRCLESGGWEVMLVGMPPALRSKMLATMRALHDEFRAHRTGAAERIGAA